MLKLIFIGTCLDNSGLMNFLNKNNYENSYITDRYINYEELLKYIEDDSKCYYKYIFENGMANMVSFINFIKNKKLDDNNFNLGFILRYDKNANFSSEIFYNIDDWISDDKYSRENSFILYIPYDYDLDLEKILTDYPNFKINLE